MAFRALGIAFALSALAVAGCGTVTNLVAVPPEAGGKTPFGGVQHDLNHIQTVSTTGPCGPNGCCDRTGPGNTGGTAKTLLCTVDLPFSFVGDVVTWPYTAGYTWINQPVPVPAPMGAPEQPLFQPQGIGQPVPPTESLPAPRKDPAPVPENPYKKSSPTYFQ